MSLRPKSTIAEIGNLLVGFNSNLKLGTLGRTSGELVSITSEISSKQNTLIRLQGEQLEAQERQLSVQKQMLLQQELQTLIQEQEQLRKRRQRELKDIIFSIKTEIDVARSKSDLLTRYFLLELLQKDIRDKNINPSDLEELQDKEYANRTIADIGDDLKQIQDQLLDGDIDQINTLNECLPHEKKMKSRLSQLGECKKQIDLAKSEKPISNKALWALRIIKYLSLAAWPILAVLSGSNDSSGIQNLNVRSVGSFISFVIFVVSALFLRKKNIVKKISRALGRVNLKSIDELLATFDDLTVKIDEVTSKLNPIFLEHPGLGFLRK